MSGAATPTRRKKCIGGLGRIWGRLWAFGVVVLGGGVECFWLCSVAIKLKAASYGKVPWASPGDIAQQAQVGCCMWLSGGLYLAVGWLACVMVMEPVQISAFAKSAAVLASR